MGFLDNAGLTHFWSKVKSYVDTKVESSSGGDDFENCTTTMSTSNGVKTITQTYTDRTLVSIISTLGNGDRQIVETLTTNTGLTKTKTTVINKLTGVITENVS